MMSEKLQTFINLMAKLISYATTLLISFFLTPYIIDRLGSEAYSFYPMANNFVNCIGPITVALNSMASRFVTIALAKNEKEKANTYFASIFLDDLILALVLLIPCILVVVFLDKIINIPLDLILSVKLLFAFVFISMIVSLITNVFGIAVFSKNKLYLCSISEICVGVLRVVLYLILFLAFTPTITYVGVVSLVTTLVTSLFQIAYTRKLLPEMKISKKYFKFETIKEVVSSGIWNTVNQIGTVLLSSINLMVCNSLYGVEVGGVYSIALTFPHFMSGIISLLSSVFLPGLMIKYATENKNAVLNHVHFAQTVIGVMCNIPIAVFLAVGINFYELWVPSVDSTELYIFTVWASAYLMVTSVCWPLSNMNVVTNNVKVPAIVMVLTGIANVIIIYFLYKFTTIGAISILISQCILYILNKIVFVCPYTAKTVGVKWYAFYQPIVKSIISTGILFVIGNLINSYVNPVTWISLIIECVVIYVVGLLINWFIVLNNREKSLIFELLKKIKR